MAKLTPEQNARCEELFPVVGKLALHFCERRGVGDLDSIESAMTEGLIKGIQSGVDDESYLKTCMWNSAVDYLRHENLRSSSPISRDFSHDNDPLENASFNEGMENVSKAIESLPPGERDVVEGRLAGATFKSLGENAKKMFDSAIRKIRFAVGSS